jgi:hypothetical protein
MVAFLESLPTPMLGIVFCTFAVVATTSAQLIVHSRWKTDARRPLNEVTGFIIAVVGVVYAVLLASIAILAIERYDRADDIVETEAGVVSDIYRDAVGLPEPVRDEIRQTLRSYLAVVVDKEWNEMQLGGLADRDWQAEGWGYLSDLLDAMAGFNPATIGQQVFMDEILDQINALNDARRSRMFLAHNPIDEVIWGVVIVGGISTVLLALLFGVASAPGHLLVSNILAFSIGLVLLLIFVMDRPFSGSSRVTPEPFVYVQDRLAVLNGS